MSSIRQSSWFGHQNFTNAPLRVHHLFIFFTWYELTTWFIIPIKTSRNLLHIYCPLSLPWLYMCNIFSFCLNYGFHFSVSIVNWNAYCTKDTYADAFSLRKAPDNVLCTLRFPLCPTYASTDSSSFPLPLLAGYSLPIFYRHSHKGDLTENLWKLLL